MDTAAFAIGIVTSLVLTTLVNALVIWIVSKLNLGLRVSGFGGAILAALVIAFVNFLLALLLTAASVSMGTGILGSLVALVVAAVVLLIGDKILPNLKVSGFGGAILAAIAIAVFNWLIGVLLAALGLVIG